MVSFSTPKPRDLALIGVYSVVTIDILASALTIPIMPFYVAQVCGCGEDLTVANCEDPLCNRLGGASSSLGFMFSSFAIAQLLSTCWLGPLSDAIGRRAIMAITLGGAGVGMIGSSIAPSYAWLVATRIFIGACSGTMSTANAYIADISAPKERPALMANVGTLVQLCFMFGPGVGAGLAELDRRAPFWVGAGTSFFALVLAMLYLKPPEELFPNGLPSDSKSDSKSSDSKPADAAPEATNWTLIGILGAGSLASNMAMSSIMTCQALYLKEIFGFGSLQFGFVMMGTATFGIIVRTMVFEKIQTALGLMRTATLGAVMGTVTYSGYSLLGSGHLSMYTFFVLAGVGTVGSTFSGSSVTPFFSQLGNRSNMGRIMSINSMASSAGRVVGPPLFGFLYAFNIRYPYRVASSCTAVAALVYWLVDVLARQAAAVERPPKPLAELDAEKRKRPSFFLQSAEKAALDALTETFRATIIHRGYDLSNAKVVELITDVLETSLPPREEGRTDEELLGVEAAFLHAHIATYQNKEAVRHALNNA